MMRSTGRCWWARLAGYVTVSAMALMGVAAPPAAASSSSSSTVQVGNLQVTFAGQAQTGQIVAGGDVINPGFNFETGQPAYGTGYSVPAGFDLGFSTDASGQRRLHGSVAQFDPSNPALGAPPTSNAVPATAGEYLLVLDSAGNYVLVMIVAATPQMVKFQYLKQSSVGQVQSQQPSQPQQQTLQPQPTPTPGSQSTAPVVAGLSPSSGPDTGGQTITITGSGFTGASGVSFGDFGTGQNIQVAPDGSSLQVVTPKDSWGDGPVSVQVTTPAGTSALTAADQYTYEAAQGTSAQGTTTVILQIGSTTATVDGQSVTLDVPAQIISARTMVPLRFLASALGAQVGWDATTRTVTYSLGSTQVVLQIGSTTATVDGQGASLDVPPTIVGGRTLVPVRFVSEELGASVQWDGSTQSVTIDYPAPTTQPTQQTTQPQPTQPTPPSSPQGNNGKNGPYPVGYYSLNGGKDYLHLSSDGTFTEYAPPAKGASGVGVEEDHGTWTHDGGFIHFVDQPGGFLEFYSTGAGKIIANTDPQYSPPGFDFGYIDVYQLTSPW